jgi:hypothetical protein
LNSSKGKNKTKDFEKATSINHRENERTAAIDRASGG